MTLTDSDRPAVGETTLASVEVVPVSGAGINDGQTMDNSLINASSGEFTVSSIGCAYRAELILGR